MTIKEVEQKTGLQRSNIRFYEKEKLIAPERNGGNGYREYSEKDVEEIKKIAYLRTLGISVEDIRRIISKEFSLYNVIEIQEKTLEQQITDLKSAKAMCQKMLNDRDLCFEELEIERYVPDMEEQWKENRKIFQMDSVGFLYLWGGTMMWGILLAVSLITALIAYFYLPEKIPVQWAWNGDVSSLADKKYIYGYPAACIIIRFLMRPFIWTKLQIREDYGDTIADYVTNYMCFLVVSAEVFSILFIYGILKHITVVLLLDTVVLIGLLLIGWTKLAKMQMSTEAESKESKQRE